MIILDGRGKYSHRTERVSGDIVGNSKNGRADEKGTGTYRRRNSVSHSVDWL